MALTATIHNFDIQLSDVDRGVYEAIAVRVARHPSETEEYLLTRVLAYCLEYTEGITFSKGLAEPDEPAIAVRDLTGAMQAWIDIGAPDATRLHKASKAAPRVAVYTNRDPAAIVRQLAGQRIHRAEELEHVLHRDRAARRGRELVERRDRVPERAARRAGDESERGVRHVHALAVGDPAQQAQQVGQPRALEDERLAARAHRRDSRP
jgi:uncharacterized protein YaeQ